MLIGPPAKKLEVSRRHCGRATIRTLAPSIRHMRRVLPLLLSFVAGTAGAAPDPWADPPPQDADPAPAADPPRRPTANRIVMVGAHLWRHIDVVRREFTYDTRFYVLVDGGHALIGMAALADPSGLARHREDHPGQWTTWRTAGAAYEVKTGSGWEKLTRFDPAPAGFKLTRGYRRAATSVPDARNVSVTAWSTVRFDANGRFTSGGGAGVSGDNVQVTGRDAERGGRYEIAGYTLTLRFDDGTTVVRTIVVGTDRKTIWIDGTAYTG